MKGVGCLETCGALLKQLMGNFHHKMEVPWLVTCKDES